MTVGGRYTTTSGSLSVCASVYNGGDPSDIVRLCSEHLGGLNKVTENDFLSTGMELHTILAGAKRISETALYASEIINSQDVLKDIEGLGQVFDFINDYFRRSQSQLQKSSEELEKILRLVGSVYAPLSSFSRIVKHLHILGISTKIENARIRNSDNSFYLLAEDVEKLSLVIAGKSEEIGRGLWVLKGSIESTLSKISVLKDTEYNKAWGTLDKTKAVLSALSEKCLSSSETVRRVTDRSEDVSAGISNVVSSLQFHDITRQQIEHVAATLDEVVTMRSSGTSTGNTVLGLMTRIGDLQIRQLTNARDELLAAIGRIMEELRNVARNATAISRETRTLLGAMGDGTSTFLTDLTGSLSSVVSFSMESEDTQNRLFEALSSVSGTIRELSEFVAHIEGIGSEIELIALNARVKAAHSAEDGAALGVIAEAITNLSDGARTQTVVITGMLRDIRDTALRINTVTDERGDMTGGGIRDLTRNAESLSHSAGLSDERVMSALSNIAKETTVLTMAIDAIVNGISAHEKTNAVISGVIDQLSQLVERGRATVTEEENEEDRQYLSMLTSRYTMDQERFIHQSQTGTGDISTTNSMEDHLGDNVELF